jgi:hypothetical protein
MGSYTVLRDRDDGDFDHVEVNSDGSEKLLGVVASANQNAPFGPVPNEEQEMMARSLRNASLLETDWWASSDLTMTTEQTEYRQALRNLSTHANWPNLNDEDWPTKPE